MSHTNTASIQPSPSKTLPTIGGNIQITGTLKATLNLGLSRLLPFNFYVVDLAYGIIGADFLTRHGLTVNLAARQLIECLEVERATFHDSVESEDGFLTSSDTPPDANLLQTLQSEFPEVFDPSRRSRIIRHSIIASVETTTEIPVTARSRKLSPEKFRGLQAEIKRLLDQGILERSQSAWSCPIVMVSKQDGSFRLCADLVALNKILKVQKHSLPNINDFVSLAHGCNWFSSLDVKDAYYNIPVKESDRHKLTITCPLGNFSYKYLPMGLASSSAYYQRLMNEVVTGMSNVFVISMIS